MDNNEHTNRQTLYVSFRFSKLQLFALNVSGRKLRQILTHWAHNFVVIALCVEVSWHCKASRSEEAAASL
jgi:hypothetical protein